MSGDVLLREVSIPPAAWWGGADLRQCVCIEISLQNIHLFEKEESLSSSPRCGALQHPNRVSVQWVNQTHSIYRHYSLPHRRRRARLLQQHPRVVSITVDPFSPPGTSLQTPHTKGISDHQQDESGAEMALFRRGSVRSSGSGQSPTASVPIFHLSGSSGLKAAVYGQLIQSGEHHSEIPTAFRCWVQNVLDQMKFQPEGFGEAKASLEGRQRVTPCCPAPTGRYGRRR